MNTLQSDFHPRSYGQKHTWQERKQQNSSKYLELLDEYIRLENNLKKHRPSEYVEDLHPSFVEACHNIERVGYLLDTFDREGGSEN